MVTAACCIVTGKSTKFPGCVVRCCHHHLLWSENAHLTLDTVACSCMWSFSEQYCADSESNVLKTCTSLSLVSECSLRGETVGCCCALGIGREGMDMAIGWWSVCVLRCIMWQLEGGCALNKEGDMRMWSMHVWLFFVYSAFYVSLLVNLWLV